MANFPSSIFSPRVLVNKARCIFDALKTKIFYAEDYNSLADEVVAIETSLLPGSETPLPYGVRIGEADNYITIEKISDGFNEYPLPVIRAADTFFNINTPIFEGGLFIHSDNPFVGFGNAAMTQILQMSIDFENQRFGFANISTGDLSVFGDLYISSMLKLDNRFSLGTSTPNLDAANEIFSSMMTQIYLYSLLHDFTQHILDGDDWYGEYQKTRAVVGIGNIANTVYGKYMAAVYAEGEGSVQKAYGMYIEEPTAGAENHGFKTTGDMDAKKYLADGTEPVADGTYTIGAALTPGVGVPGTITTKGGIIIAIQEAT